MRLIANHEGYHGEDPVAWYREQVKRPIGYSSVLEDLTNTPEERVALLRRYFEPEDHDGAVRVEPSAAHRAVARLVSDGLIRIVITTNFDRQLERALEEVGVAPTVLATPEAVAGARPLHLQRACIVKVNGDYLDPGFLNTGAELDKYEPAVDRLLDQVFDEYGLVISGWSATWDKGLRAAIERCTTRRFGTYIVEPFGLSEEMTRLITNRDARVVAATGDAFLTRLEETIVALRDLDIAPPGSPDIAVATAKRALADGSQIRLHDLVARELRAFGEKVGDWPNQGDRPVLEAIVERIDAAVEVSLALVCTLAHWGDRKTDGFWVPTLLALADQQPQSGLSGFIDVRYYPAASLLYGAGVAMMAAGRLVDLDHLLRRRIRDLATGRPAPAASQLNIHRALSGFGTGGGADVADEHLHELLVPVLLRQLLLTEDLVERAYERFDLFLYVVARDASAPEDPFTFATPGRPWPADGMSSEKSRAMTELEQEGEAGGEHPWLAAGLFGGDKDRLDKLVEQYAVEYQRLRQFGYLNPSARPRRSPFGQR
ncbi:MAG: hypothetical protein M0004_17190 [Actinomycetota bacterium]|nr:hypothetical protein [Actinomycetota bacterium]